MDGEQTLVATHGPSVGLARVRIGRHGFEAAVRGERHQHGFALDGRPHLSNRRGGVLVRKDDGAAIVAKLVHYRLHLVLDERHHLGLVRQQVREILDRFLELLLLVAIARQVHPRDLRQGHLADLLRLDFAELEALDQLRPRYLAVFSCLEDLHDLVGMDGADDQPLDQVQALARSGEIVFAATSQHVELVLVVASQQLHHADSSWCASWLILGAEQKRHLHREAGLQAGVLVQTGKYLGRGDVLP